MFSEDLLSHKTLGSCIKMRYCRPTSEVHHAGINCREERIKRRDNINFIQCLIENRKMVQNLLGRGKHIRTQIGTHEHDNARSLAFFMK
jgi:hypothetical protein